MKKYMIFLMGILITVPTLAAPDTGARRRTMITPRAMIGTAQLGTNKSSLKWIQQASGPENTEPTNNDIDDRSAERAACLANNIGMNNTFVWASRYSDSSNYTTMVEDTENPENNVCFVRVEMQSLDPNVNLSDIDGKYFETGNIITCGSWVSQEILEQRILDATKSKRTLATIGGSVAGAGVGVGAMELFGNKLLSNIPVFKSVQGQLALKDDKLLISQLKALKNSNIETYNQILAYLYEIQKACNKDGLPPEDQNQCQKIKYQYILDQLKGN